MNPTVAIVWRGDASAERLGVASNERLRPIVDTLRARGAIVEAVVYRDETAAETQTRLCRADAVLVWVDPIGKSENRGVLDKLLVDVASTGTIVSAHPDVIAAMGTKEVVYDTRGLSWGSDVDRYASLDELRRGLLTRLQIGPRVIKQRRGNGGIGVFKVELAEPGTTPRDGTPVIVQDAQVRDTVTETCALGAFLDRCSDYFTDNGCVVDQPFQARVSEGLVRAYLVVDEVVGFAEQSAAELIEHPDDARRVMGVPSAKTMRPPTEPRFQKLRSNLETEWVPAMQRLVGVPTDRLPLLWDADFLLGPPAADGSDSYVLCEINVSCVTPFPPEAVDKVTEATLTRVVAAGVRG